MATATFIPVREYLRTSYRPDAEYVDGYLEERAMGERDHSAIQKRLILLLSALEVQGNFVCYPELRVQVSASRYRVPDVCLLRADAAWEDVVVTPPLLCIEVLSPEDTMSRTLVRVRDFLDMGVVEVWIFNAESKTVQVYRGVHTTDITEGRLAIPETSASVSRAEVLSHLQ